MICAACSAPPGTTSPDAPPPALTAKPPLDPLRAGASVVCDSTDTVGGLPAIYMLSAMNHKLQSYPDFAAALGLDLVTDCESGQRFIEGYGSYLADHPRFDADELLAPSPPDEGPLPPLETDETGETDETTKIGGTPDGVTNNPVVEISFKTCTHRGCPNAGDDWKQAPLGNLVGETFRCSATFIAKNWLLTSAHCLTAAAIDSCMEAGVERQSCDPDWPQWGQWSLHGTLTASTGDDVVGNADDVHKPYTRDGVWMRGYVQENWLGTKRIRNRLICDDPVQCYDPDESADHDVALLYIRSEYDDKLPPRVEWDGAKRLSIAQARDKSPGAGDPAGNWQVGIFGWGGPGPISPIGARPMRTRSGVFRGTTAPGPFGDPKVEDDRIDFDVVASAANPNPAYICEGDSGGPLVRIIPSLQTNVGPQSDVQAIVGVISSVEGTTLGAPPCTSTQQPLGTEWIWHAARVDQGLNRLFIETTIKRWTNTRFFNCREKALPGGSRVEVEECWGPPCSNAGMPPEGCASANDQCWSPARTVAARHSSCDACKDFTGDLAGCGCILGQCLPTK
jgi:hypothetical protein